MAIATETHENPKLICPEGKCSVAEVGSIVICGTHGWSFRYDAYMAAVAAFAEAEPVLAGVTALPVRHLEVAA